MKHFWIFILCLLSVAGCIVVPIHAGAVQTQVYSDFPHLVNSTLDNGYFDDDGLEHQPPPPHNMHETMMRLKLYKDREKIEGEDD